MEREHPNSQAVHVVHDSSRDSLPVFQSYVAYEAGAFILPTNHVRIAGRSECRPF